MKNMIENIRWLRGRTLWIAVTLLMFGLKPLFSQEMAFTYQGQLNGDRGEPLEGYYDFMFTLYDAEDPKAGAQVGPTLTNDAVSVVNGRFTAILDFGPGCFSPGTRPTHGPGEWLEIQVRTNRAKVFTLLEPRQRLMPTPYAHQLKGAIDDAALEGTYTGQVDFNNVDNRFRGNFTGEGGGLANVDATSLGGMSASNFWLVGGNTGNSGIDYLGTTDDRPLQLIVNNQRVMRLTISPGDNSPNLLVNNWGNSILSGVVGSTIAGGGVPDQIITRPPPNPPLIIPHGHFIGSDFSFIGGGYDNRVGTNAPYGVIPGGRSNEVSAAYGFAAGHRAHANHSGAFVWADSQNATFASTAANQFAVRASGGVRLETGGAGLTVDGQSVLSGEIPDVNLSDNVALRNGGNDFYGIQYFSAAVGFGTQSPDRRLHLIGTARFAGTAGGVAYPGIIAENTNDAGIAILASVDSTDASVVVANRGTGDILRGFSGPTGNNMVFRVKNDGTVGIGTSNPTRPLHVIGNTRVEGDGSGTAYPGLYVANARTNGIGIFSTVTSSDANLVVVNKGDGDVIKGFSGATGGNLVFRVNNAGYVYAQDEISCQSLAIRGGADLAEPFAMSEKEIPPGSVVVIDEDQPGRLKLSTSGYDTKVAGIVSGAGGVKPGISMIQEDALEAGQNVALSGRVYALVDASSAPIRPGDLLTTSDTPGHAMKAEDPTRTHGAILGKAMSRLESGQGLVLVLVSLQ